jgi:hypothetical protein
MPRWPWGVMDTTDTDMGIRTPKYELPGTWRLGWRDKAIRAKAHRAHLEKKGWHENAKACVEELKRLRLEGASPRIDVSRKALFVKVPPQHNREAPADGLGRG